MTGEDLTISQGTVIPYSELVFRTSRSGGPGGQNVNKVESKVELLFDPGKSRAFTESQRARLKHFLAGRLDSHGVLHLSSQISRSQLENREIVVGELVRLIKTGLKPVKKRIKTRPSGASREERLKLKKAHSEKKRLRGGRSFD